MPLARWFEGSVRVAGAPRVHARSVTAAQWRDAAQAVAAQGGRLLSIWSQGAIGAEHSVIAAFMADPGVLLLELPVSESNGHDRVDYPGLQDLFPAASRLQRALADLSGLRCDDPDGRPWLRHAAWPATFRPLRDRVPPVSAPQPASAAGSYAFVRVEGDGVHEVPVGPVHAAIIEPGHFRFSVVGEKVLRLEQRFGYAHKGIERRFSELPLRDGQRLAARISGDSAVAYSWAYCQALEGLAGTPVPARALWLRALALELERIANHLGDLGALGNDAGFAFALAQFSRLKEQLLRTLEGALGQRYLMDFIVPGGTRCDLTAQASAALLATLAAVADEAGRLRSILEQHEGVRDRFVGSGTLTASLARRLGVTGLAGRASGQGHDLRIDLPWPPYHELSVALQVRSEGDVAARVAVRFDELAESCRLVRVILDRLPVGAHREVYAEPGAGAVGVGLIEGWRGPVMIVLEAGAAGAVRRCHAHDSSWQNWPAIEHAVMDNIIADFPLINKSFNLAYSAHDL